MDGKIYEVISAVMEDCGAVGKDSMNPQQHYKYRGIDAVMNALNPAMRKHKLFVAPEVLEQTREERQTSKGGLLIYSIVKVKYTFWTTDGSSVSATVIGEGMDSGDKATNKAMSAAFKYALFQVFCIPTEEMKDSEIDSPEPVAEKTITEKEATILSGMLKQNQIEYFLQYFHKKSMTELTAGEYTQIIRALQAKEKKNANESKTA